LTFSDEPVDPNESPEHEPVCESSTVSGEEHIADFEDGTTSGWWDSYDATPTASHEPLSVEGPGAAETEYALVFSGTGHEDWGANVGVSLGCTDVSEFDGITFYAKGLARRDQLVLGDPPGDPGDPDGGAGGSAGAGGAGGAGND